MTVCLGVVCDSVPRVCLGVGCDGVPRCRV